MAAGPIDPSAASYIPGHPVVSRNNNMHTHALHEKEKQLVSAIRAPLQRAGNPFLVTDRRNQKQLCVASKNLGVNDFLLLKTLGTG